MTPGHLFSCVCALLLVPGAVATRPREQEDPEAAGPEAIPEPGPGETGTTCELGEDECFGKRLVWCAARRLGRGAQFDTWLKCVVGNLNAAGKQSFDRDTYNQCMPCRASELEQCAHDDESLAAWREVNPAMQALFQALLTQAAHPQQDSLSSALVFFNEQIPPQAGATLQAMPAQGALRDDSEAVDSGLENAVEVDGKRGRLQSLDAGSGRRQMEVQGVGSFKLRPERLRPSPRDSEAMQASLSDVTHIGHHTSPKCACDRCSCEFPAADCSYEDCGDSTGLYCWEPTDPTSATLGAFDYQRCTALAGWKPPKCAELEKC